MKIFHIRFLRNHWLSNRKLSESCKKLAIASGRGGGSSYNKVIEGAQPMIKSVEEATIFPLSSLAKAHAAC